ncbi:sensor histidine kinase [Alteraurantiacibacter palmitatis]|uniref:histidine kinase n=1 Tax=Alteraurantiacibacter palmitatis TaxID=2054628 RepID=A0ABV7E7Y5_9SPHN
MRALFRKLAPKSLLGQMLLAVAVALMVAQTISAVLQYRASEQRREGIALNALAFQLVTEPRFDFRQPDRRGAAAMGRWQRLRVQKTEESPLLPGEVRDSQREAALQAILADQGVQPVDLIVLTRDTVNDPFVMAQLREQERTEWAQGRLLVAAMRRDSSPEWTVARWAVGGADPGQLGALIAQTLLLYVILVGGLAILLRRITRPLAALADRVERFAETRQIAGQLEPSGPEDTRRLITAHNAMEARIVALIDEKDVMLGAIGHDLKTPLAALRVRIESVEDETERARMAHTIEDITRSLDDILSLARVGRPSDPLERTDLAALVASVVEEYEDMGDAVELGETTRLPMKLRATWLRRALRNLIGNALRYGATPHISLGREGGEAVIRIADNGPGIPEGEIATMMEPFKRGEGSRNRETGGAGLGLTLARAIAEQHGGHLSLTNRHDKAGKVIGLTAEIRLPLGA